MRDGRASGTATVLFTDLVGSTELMAHLGELAYDELRGLHFARLRKAVAAYDGDEVKNTGDGLLATFGAAADALRAAVAIQQATDRQSSTADVALSVRVGVALGDVTFEDGDVFGAPVVEAARLVAAARPGQILVTSVVRMVGGGRSGVAFTDLGPLQLKGLPDPVPACEVAWAPLPDVPVPAVPLPPLLLSAGRIFVGREEELERLHQRWKDVAAGERRLVLVGGEPGVGKTRMATELAHSLHGEGAVVLAGRCDEDLGVPYQPFVEALRHYVAHASNPRLGRYAGELGRLVPELTQLVPGLPEPLRSDPETERYRLFDAVATWLADVSAETPVLLVLDDLQWAAKPTLLLLRHVLRSPDPARVLVIATYRDTDVGRGHPLTELLADVRRLEGAERLAVAGLDATGVLALVETAAGHTLDAETAELARVVWRETEGNPFFVTEILRHMFEAGAVQLQEERWVVTTTFEELGVPEGVRDVVGRRLSRLSDETNRVLAWASVAGLEFETGVVQAAGGFTEDAVLSALEEAVASRLVVEVSGGAPRNRFSHTLVRATLYDELTAARRVAMHRKVAEAIEAIHHHRLDDQLPALAHHWARASAPAADTARAVDYATRAGDQALSQLANDEAVTYYRQALELLDAGDVTGGPARLEILIALGEAQRRAGDPAHRETLLGAARLAQESGDADALARAALANSRGIFSISARVDSERVAVLDGALAATGDDDSAPRARLLATLAVELVFSSDDERRQWLLDEAMALARRLGDPATLGYVLTRHWTPAPPGDQTDEVLEMTELAARLGDPALAFWADFINACSALVVADPERLERQCRIAEDRARDLGQPFLHWLVGLVRANQARISGHLDDAERLAEATLQIGRAAGLPDAAGAEGVQVLWVRFDQGRLGELIERIDRAFSRPDPEPLREVLFAFALAELGRTAQAAAVLDNLAAGGFAAFPRNFCWLQNLSTAAGACAATGQAQHAAVLYHQLAPHRGLVGSGGASITGAVDHFLGLLATTLGRPDEADAHFAAAAGIHQRMGAPTLLARTHLEWATMLLRRGQPGDAERAQELLTQALAVAVDLGLGTVERRARALLARPGGVIAT